jgi:hypothetical protein
LTNFIDTFLNFSSFQRVPSSVKLQVMFSIACAITRVSATFYCTPYEESSASVVAGCTWCSHALHWHTTWTDVPSAAAQPPRAHVASPKLVGNFGCFRQVLRIPAECGIG